MVLVEEKRNGPLIPEEDRNEEESGCFEKDDVPTEYLPRMTEVPALDDIRERAYRLCRDYLRGAWRKVSPSELIVRKISGGLSNLLYYVSLPEHVVPLKGEPSRILLRLYGQHHGEHALQGLIAESVIFTLLSESQRGPRLYGVFAGGRLEEYIAARPLETYELADPGLSVLIAEKMGQIHLMSVPINKEPRWLWDTMDRWMTEIAEFVRQEPIRDVFQAMVRQVVDYDLQKEHDWLRAYLLSAKSPVLFCHNDMQEGNILLRCADPAEQARSPEEEQRHLIVIDYEYCAYNYRAFDIANHMCEWVYDYGNEQPPYFHARQEAYPTQPQQELFLRSYLRTMLGREASVDEVEVLSAEVQAFTLASHFFWGLWSVVNASKSTIHFDYWGFGRERFERYFKRKADVTQSDRPGETEEPIKSLENL